MVLLSQVNSTLTVSNIVCNLNLILIHPLSEIELKAFQLLSCKLLKKNQLMCSFTAAVWYVSLIHSWHTICLWLMLPFPLLQCPLIDQSLLSLVMVSTVTGFFSIFSHKTQTSSWLPPRENWDPGTTALPYGWEAALDKNRKPYYIK